MVLAVLAAAQGQVELLLVALAVRV